VSQAGCPRSWSSIAQAHHLRELESPQPPGVHFITLRRRSRKMMEAIAAEPLLARKRIELEGVSRSCRPPRILDRGIVVCFQKRAQNPLLQAANFHKTGLPVPWLAPTPLAAHTNQTT